jgi:hypothetical protein
MSENSVKFESLLESNNLNVDDLTPKIQEKIANFDTIYDAYTDAEEGSVEEKDAFAKLKAMDEGISNDIKSFIEEKQKNFNENAPADNAPANKTSANDTSTNDQSKNDTPSEEGKPSWAFWM